MYRQEACLEARQALLEATRSVLIKAMAMHPYEINLLCTADDREMTVGLQPDSKTLLQVACLLQRGAIQIPMDPAMVTKVFLSLAPKYRLPLADLIFGQAIEWVRSNKEDYLEIEQMVDYLTMVYRSLVQECCDDASPFRVRDDVLEGLEEPPMEGPEYAAS